MIEKLLEERRGAHGDWALQSSYTDLLRKIVVDGKNWWDLSPSQRSALEMICSKIGRILAGNPNHRDHWDDIAGYATLAAKELDAPKENPIARYINDPLQKK